MKRTPSLAGGVALGYMATGFLFYRERVKSPARLWGSDLIVFFLPMMLAFSLFAWALWPQATPAATKAWPRLWAVGLAALATGLSFWAYAFAAFNLYGT